MKKLSALAVTGLILAACTALAATGTGNAPDYSQKASWY